MSKVKYTEAEVNGVVQRWRQRREGETPYWLREGKMNRWGRRSRLSVRLAANYELKQKNRRTPLIGRTQTKEKARRLKQMQRKAAT